MTDTQKDRQDRQTDGRTDRRTEGQTDRQKDRQSNSNSAVYKRRMCGESIEPSSTDRAAVLQQFRNLKTTSQHKHAGMFRVRHFNNALLPLLSCGNKSGDNL